MNHPFKNILLGIKGAQLLFVCLIVILEIVQAAYFVSVYDQYIIYGGSGSYEYFTGYRYGKAGSVVWVFIVMLITFLSVVAYLTLFSKGYIWEKRHETYFVGFDAFFFVLWFTEVFTNLYWAYKGDENPCYYYTAYSDTISYVDYKSNALCGAYIASNVFGWFLLITFSLGAGFSYKIHNDSKNENSSDNNMQQSIAAISIAATAAQKNPVIKFDVLSCWQMVNQSDS
ncbi:4564_t:CDS:2 [Acaulospora morrowiae]|uniref:4564_t:CDS:1 n=1 Tax=Acaulospora morrowiae TaxID=94023 RepID=A0A9N8W1R8_9GLOM|nr:4564_t:CDS:2 [Acaulospora morrowiae]